MATQAAKNAMEDAGVTAEEIDLIIVATVLRNTYVPNTPDRAGRDRATVQPALI